MREGGASFHTTRTLGPGQSLTIVVGFPKGVVTPPGAAQRASWFLAENWGTLAGIGGAVLLFAFLYWRWSLVGRDPRAAPQYPRYEAPKGLGPAGVRYIDRMGYDDRCFAAGLLGLGARGEKVLADWLLPSRNAIQTLSKGYDPAVAVARESFAAGLAAHFGKHIFSKNHGSFIAGLFIAFAVFGIALVLEAPQGVLIAMAAAMLLMLFLFKRWLPAYSVLGRKLQDHIDGLRQYLSVAEADDLARMKAPPQTPQEFAKFLPYAVALDVEKTWADRFVASLGAAAVSAAVADYYLSSDGDGGFDSFGSGFGSAMSDIAGTVASASTAPGQRLVENRGQSPITRSSRSTPFSAVRRRPSEGRPDWQGRSQR